MGGNLPHQIMIVTNEALPRFGWSLNAYGQCCGSLLCSPELTLRSCGSTHAVMRSGCVNACQSPTQGFFAENKGISLFIIPLPIMVVSTFAQHKQSRDLPSRGEFSAPEDEDDSHHDLLRRTTIGNGPPESVFDWTMEIDSDLSNQNMNNQAFSRKHWRLLQCQNGLRIFEELLEVEFLPKSCSRAMKAVGVVDATCEELFELVMSMDTTRFEWDCSFQYGSLVEEVDGHTAVLYHRLLQLDWFPMFVWPRDLCYVRYWRRNDDGSYVVLFRSREHEKCGSQPGFVRAHIESGGFNISPLKPRRGRPRAQVQHLMQIDLKGWGVGYISAFQQYCLLQMLNSVSGLREYFSQTDERCAPPRIPVMVNMASASVPSKKSQKLPESSVGPSLDQINAANKNAVMMDEYSDEDDELQTTDQEACSSGLESEVKKIALEEESTDQIDLSCFSGNLRRNDRENGRDCWKISDGNNFKVRSKNFCYDKSKIPAGKHLMDLVSVDWFKDSKRMDHVARCHGCAAQVASEKGFFSIVVNLQVPGSTHYSMVFYFVTKELVHGSLLQRFVDGDDEFRTSRLKLIPSVPKVSPGLSRNSYYFQILVLWSTNPCSSKFM
ncbi:similar to ENHANCED DISEASE RESISTANCE 2 [Actinidia rufa]|uniref:Similar to ENHANCED DISEASE RESISTANCE 2 n=1 Tax=Actinidia rufa TaxID=165716 RepID=A0A7J0H0L7_9ERIC|nr:similar to ENHANCED DISEASE RESISTANCE 2 [Actinidia rufa]